MSIFIKIKYKKFERYLYSPAGHSPRKPSRRPSGHGALSAYVSRNRPRFSPAENRVCALGEKVLRTPSFFASESFLKTYAERASEAESERKFLAGEFDSVFSGEWPAGRNGIISKNKKSGFTIVELLVAMSIFIILVTIATGAFIQALRSERRLLALMSVSNNVSLVLEQMTREIRTGYLFSAGGTELSFSSAASVGDITYNLNGGKIQRNNQDVTASNVSVSNLRFIVSRSGDVCNPWRVTILATVNAFPATVNPITLQTTASSRILPKEVPRSVKSLADIKNCI